MLAEAVEKYHQGPRRKIGGLINQNTSWCDNLCSHQLFLVLLPRAHDLHFVLVNENFCRMGVYRPFDSLMHIPPPFLFPGGTG